MTSFPLPSPAPRDQHASQPPLTLPRLPWNDLFGRELTSSKSRGVILGMSIGGALGLPLQSMTADEIDRVFGKVTNYLPPGDGQHTGNSLGLWSRGTQRGVALATLLLEQDRLNLAVLTPHHQHASLSLLAGAKTENSKKDGLNNDIIVRLGPFAMLAYARGPALIELSINECIALTRMAHAGPLAGAAALTYLFALLYCIGHDERNFSVNEFAAWVMRGVQLSGAAESDPDVQVLSERLALIPEAGTMSDVAIRMRCGASGIALTEALPLSYLFFAREPDSVACLYSAVNAGGDAEGNGALVGSLYGALGGALSLPPVLQCGLVNLEKLVAIADQLQARFSRLATGAGG